MGNGAGVVAVPGADNMIYVREHGKGIPFIVYNFRIQNAVNQPVVVGEEDYSPGIMQVLGLNVLNGVRYLPGAGIPPHGGSHAWGGADPAYINLRQIMDVIVYSPGGLQCYVRAGYVKNVDGTLRKIYAQTIDLTSHRPSGAGMYRWVLVTVNTDGDIVLTDGDDNAPLDFSYADTPAIPGDHVGLVYIKLREGDTALTDSYNESDFIDIRFLPSAASTASHHTQHEAGGSDQIKLDNLATPDDTSDLDATTGHHGLLPKLSNESTEFLNGVGQWTVPAGGEGESIPSAFKIYISTTFR
jgi:hypothetical protein